MKTLLNTAEDLLRDGDASKALGYLNQAREIEKDNDRLLGLLGLAHLNLGDIDLALNALDKAVLINPQNYEAYYRISQARKFTSKDKGAVEQIESQLSNGNLSLDERAIISFSLGKIYDDLKDYNKAFGFYTQANNLKASFVKFDLNQAVINANRFVNVFNKDWIKDKFGILTRQDSPIFIVGMPRSGTSLIEQILSSHSAVCGVGEKIYMEEIAGRLSGKIRHNQNASQRIYFPECVQYMQTDEFDSVASQYMQMLSKDNKDCMHIINKLPSNYVFLPLISVLFPNAKIIHCNRHPLDIFLSIYFQNFSHLEYSFDPVNIIGYYKVYHQMMKIWQSILPIEIFNLRYEDILHNQEDVTRHLLDFCKLDWQNNCLNFHNNKNQVYTASYVQVKQKIYKDSLYKWQKYQEFLGDVSKHLEGEVEEYCSSE